MFNLMKPNKPVLHANQENLQLILLQPSAMNAAKVDLIPCLIALKLVGNVHLAHFNLWNATLRV